MIPSSQACAGGYYLPVWAAANDDLGLAHSGLFPCAEHRFPLSRMEEIGSRLGAELRHRCRGHGALHTTALMSKSDAHSLPGPLSLNYGAEWPPDRIWWARADVQRYTWLQVS
jgi:hypothetical protein